MKLIHRIVWALAALGFSATTWASGGSAPGEGSQIPPTDWGLQIWTLAAFVILFGALAKFAFKPIARALDQRSQMIKSSMDAAEKSRAEAKQLMEDYQKQIAEARSEANKLIEESRLLGEKVRKEIVEKANAEAAASVQRAQEEIQRQQEKGIQELQDTVARLSVDIAARVIEKEVNAATHKQLVEDLIKNLGTIRRA